MIKCTIDRDGTKRWFKNGVLHRVAGPAVVFSNGETQWWVNGKIHREDGPAIEWNNGLKRWYWNGEGYTKEEYVLLQFTNGALYEQMFG